MTNARACPIRIRAIDSDSKEAITIIAQRMRQTLIEVLGEEQGSALYTTEWLVQRVLWHLDPSQVVGQVYVAERGDGTILGHTIVRIEKEEERTIGLFSTTYVDPPYRRSGVASQLLRQGEEWIWAQGMTEAVTYTDENNQKLQNLYIGQGYALTRMPNQFVQLAKSRPHGPSSTTHTDLHHEE